MSDRAHIVVVGGGIAGLTAALYAAESGAARVTLLEQCGEVGGHELTVRDGGEPADVGFQVYNDWTYPHFARLLQRLGVETCETDMSFGIESQFGGWRHAAEWRPYARWLLRDPCAVARFVASKARFHGDAARELRLMAADDAADREWPEQRLGDWLTQRRYAPEFEHGWVRPFW